MFNKIKFQEFNLDTAYQLAIAERVRTVCERANTPLSLHQIVVQSDGAYPSDVCAVLDTLGISYDNDVKTSTIIAHPHTEGLSFCSCAAPGLLADPHPADYDWRFDASTVNDLANRLQDTSRAANETGIALLGVKTVFPRLYSVAQRVTLFDNCQTIINDLQQAGYPDSAVVACDLCNPIAEPHRGYTVALADPPWYLDYYQAFMTRAAEMLHEGGLLYLSVLPRLTRPSALHDRAELLRYGTALGFTLVRQEAGALAYETPFFERQGLSANGLLATDWRRGDLWVWQKHNPSSIALPPQPVREAQWREFRIGRKRIKVRQLDGPAAATFQYEPADIQQGSILLQVSRRSAVRARIVVWSSDNRAYFVTRPEVVERCLAAWHSSVAAMATFVRQQADLTPCEQESLLVLLEELIQ